MSALRALGLLTLVVALGACAGNTAQDADQTAIAPLAATGSSVTCDVLDRSDTDLIVKLTQPNAAPIVVQLVGDSAGRLCMIDSFAGNCPVCPGGVP